MENLRHLRALQAFNETATHANLSKAADILNVTHGAVSRQIKVLELHLGVTLFHRRANGMELTKAGEKLYLSTKQAFSALQLGVLNVKRLNNRQSIKISLPTSVALKWLVPRLPNFRQQHPSITLFLDTDDAIMDFDTSDVDIALRFGTPPWEGLYTRRISDEELVVVAAPSLIGDAQVPMPARDIATLPLLHDAFNDGWGEWADQAGLNPDQITAQSTKYFDSAVLLEAAIDRQGAALARHLLAARDLELGRLVRLDDTRVSLARGLYFVCRHSDETRNAIKVFKDWLLSI